ncbi:hypothetical protein HJG54_15720 [Leptolyngbya sp. NK1-12]|uniref:Uncharacterized protein n=1 Tax=Leptolyngbya sp. NK1-12 TaxID=2547451 RepID=A0AA96WV89_9CYAN|nr:hypothetical protein [Leptolyngbya sp. NK1-12]WNZ24162.1 hypothetical protein HJG54_15720 [Leptolyngbya sp. NK1-12]
MGKRLCLTFPYRWQAIVGVNEASPQWQTLTKYPLRPRVLWRLWQDASQLVGVRFDDQTRYGVIDIDQGSPYYPSQNPHALATLRAALETIGIYRTVVIRSSWSGGLHLYLPLPEAVPTFGLASALQQCLEAQDLSIAQAQLEVFPNCKSYAYNGSYSEYNAHRLPLQPHSGSCLLDADLNPTFSDLGRFFEQWDLAAAAQDMRELREAISTARTNRRGKRRCYTNDIEAWLSDLRTEMAEGWTGYGQTNHLLKTIACYGVVFEGLQDEELTEFIHTSAIQAPGYFQWCRHQHEIKLKAAVWARSAQGYYWRLGDERQREGIFHGSGTDNVIPFSKNLQRSQEAQERIRTIVSQLTAEGTLPETPTARARVIAAQGVSLKTLYRHPELWHPDHWIAIEQWCKTPDVEPDLAIKEENSEELSESSKSSDGKEFYTSESLMKGRAIESGLVPFPSASSVRRSSMSEQCLENFPKSSSAQEFEASNVIQLCFPQLALFNSLDPTEVETDCLEAMVWGDRYFVLRRLVSLWSEGHADLVRDLCKRHSDWKFEVRACGPVEVNRDAP